MNNFVVRPPIKSFTLAEILITLLIIGVVASLTIPVISAKIQYLEDAALLKKVYSTFANATNSAKEDNGGTMLGYWPDHDTIHDNTIGTNSFANVYSRFIKTDKVCNSNPGPADPGQCWHKNDIVYNQDGTKAAWGWCAGCSTLQASQGFWAMVWVMENYTCDGVIFNGPKDICLGFWVDTNGANKPNRIGYDIHRFYTTRGGLGYENDGRTYDLLNK